MGNTCGCQAVCGDDTKDPQSSLYVDLQIFTYSDDIKSLEGDDYSIATEKTPSGVNARRPTDQLTPPYTKTDTREVSFTKLYKQSKRTVTNTSSRDASRSGKIRGMNWGLKKPEKSMEVSFLMDDREAEEILLEGELLRVRPNLTQQFTSRWVQLTETELRYYKNQWNANCWLNKPLFALPLTDIVEVKK